MASKFDLDERLIKFAGIVIKIAQSLPSNFAGNHLASQLIRSGTSPALNYAEALAAESRADFIHKMKIGLKELRETYTCLRIIQQQNWFKEDKLPVIINENSQLIAIFVKSIETAKINKVTAYTKK